MTKKKRTVITEESHEIWIIRHRSGEPAERTQSENNSTAINLVSVPPHIQVSDFFQISSNSDVPDDSPSVTENADSTGSDYEINES